MDCSAPRCLVPMAELKDRRRTSKVCGLSPDMGGQHS